MSVRIHIDNPHAFYTNLDVVSGKIVLSLSADETVSAITVKLEGESKTSLIRPPPGPNEIRQRSRLDDVLNENHKILYKIQQVFPPPGHPGHQPTSPGVSKLYGGLPNVLQDTIGGSGFTLRAGLHEYPFTFKIPFNNMCQGQTGPTGMGMRGMGIGGLRLMDMPGQMPYQHVKSTLPPSLNGFPGEAEIRYYIKVTVQRPSLFKENRRSQIAFKFLPIEPLRSAPTSAETFARRSHNFLPGNTLPSKRPMFGKAQPMPLSSVPPQISVDARLPSPSILTCNSPIPLRILLKRQNNSTDTIFLIGLQIELIGHTIVRTYDVQRVETGKWPIVSLMNITRPIAGPEDTLNDEIIIDRSLWEYVKLPPTISPSFTTCNLTRSYELEVRLTLGFGVGNQVQPQHITLPLRFPVQVYSGIAPPPQLVAAMTSPPTGLGPVNTSPPHAATTPSTSAVPSLPPRPASNVAAHLAQPVHDPLYPPQLLPGQVAAEEAPPSYEDAVADDIAPVNGNRGEFSGVATTEGPSEVDEKGRKALPGVALGRHSSDGRNNGAGPSGLGGRGRGSAVV